MVGQRGEERQLKGIGPNGRSDAGRLIARHLLIGWIGLFVFLTLGIVLEMLHGFKVAAYLDMRFETRRLMWTLAHAHGTLFSLIHLGFAGTMAWMQMNEHEMGSSPVSRSLGWASWLLTGALLSLPLGFLLGGAQLYAGDPGLGILLVPFGAALLMIAVGLTVANLAFGGAGGRAVKEVSAADKDRTEDRPRRRHRR